MQDPLGFCLANGDGKLFQVKHVYSALAILFKLCLTMKTYTHQSIIYSYKY